MNGFFKRFMSSAQKGYQKGDNFNSSMFMMGLGLFGLFIGYKSIYYGT